MKTNNIDLRHLRYFIAVAEELNFTRAAERLGIRQPPLSMQIRQLEDALDARLFRRLPRGVELTEAGEGFLADARDILVRLDQAATEARRRSSGQLGNLRIGFAGATYLSTQVTGTVQAFRQAHPGVGLHPDQSNTPALLTALLDGKTDAAFIRPPIHDDPRIAVVPMVEEEMVIALASGHKLAQSTAPVPLSALKDEVVILFPPEIGPGLHAAVVDGLHAAGVHPKLWESAPQITSIAPLVAAGFGVAVLPRSVGRLRLDGVVYQEISGQSPVARISLATRAGDPSPLVRAFHATARRFALKSGRTAQDLATRPWP